MKALKKFLNSPEGTLACAVVAFSFIAITINSIEVAQRKSRDKLKASECLDRLSDCEGLDLNNLKIDEELRSKLDDRLDEFQVLGPAIECIKKEGYSYLCNKIDADKVARYDERLATKLALVIANKQDEDASRRDAYSQNLKRSTSKNQRSYQRKRLLDADNTSQSNEIASVILSVACGARTGIVPRWSMGTKIREILESNGFSANDVYNNWEFYWQIAKGMNQRGKLNCIK